MSTKSKVNRRKYWGRAKLPLALVLLVLLLAVANISNRQTLKDYKIKVEEELPHDVTAYTQGLFFHNGFLYESTGQYGESSFRKVDLKSGKVLQRINFDKKYFIEGSCVIDGKLFLLTWMEKICFVYDIDSFKQIGQFYVQGEGWGLTTDGKYLIMSDGSSTITFRNPSTFMPEKQINVTLNNQPLNNINELEYVNGTIWANVYGTDFIVIIDPSSGDVKGRVDCRNLLPAKLMRHNTDVLNGIAYHPEEKAIYITGKYWPRLYKISLVEK